MLVLQTEKVPNKPIADNDDDKDQRMILTRSPSKYFSNLLHTANQLVGEASCLQCEETSQNIFNNNLLYSW